MIEKKPAPFSSSPAKPPAQAAPATAPTAGAGVEGEFEVRLRLPREEEMFGVVHELMGASHMKIRCEDGKMRMCRVVGKMRKHFWIQEGDIVVVAPWTFQTKDTKGDIVWRYTKTQVFRLKREGRLDWMSDDEGKEIVFDTQGSTGYSAGKR